MFHRCIGKILSALLRHETKLFFCVLIPPSALFIMSVSGGANWYSMCVCFLSNILMLLRPYCLESGFLVETIFLLGKGAVFTGLSEFLFQSDS